MSSSILTSTGKYVDFVDLKSNFYDIIDIASALSKICRFTGHCNKFYSVAQHSVLVSQIVPVEFAMEGLLHDATEAYIGDVSTPLKNLLPEYQKIEKELYKDIATCFEIPETISKEVKIADLVMLVTEKRDLFPYDLSNKNWSFDGEDILALKEKIVPLDHISAYDLFIDRYLELCNDSK